MASKAELELELAELRRQLAMRDQPEVKESAAPEAATPPVEEDIDGGELAIDWEKEVSELMTQFDDITHKKPLLFALGAFSIGFLLGRSK